ncbi:MAG: TonB-dependent receptor plug domain-containing protein [bacterium]
MHTRNSIKTILLLCIILAVSSLCRAAITDFKEEIDTLLLFYKKEDVVITPTRHLKPILRVAENISVITAEDMEMINAHTLNDVLNIVPGIQFDSRGGPGSVSPAHIQGSDFTHVLVMIDGITLNNLSDSFADIAAIPVQNIERVEIIKGPASSSWGSSLGGVINIITKAIPNSEGLGGTLFGSFGERNTRDYRAEGLGRKEKAGFYVYAGNLESEGLTVNTPFEEDSFYTKLAWDASERGKLLFTLGLNEGTRGMGEFTASDLSCKNDFEYLFSSLSFDYKINRETGLRFSIRTSIIETENIYSSLSTKEELARDPLEDTGYGISAQYNTEKSIHSFVFGMDLDKRKIKTEDDAGEKFELEQEKWAVFANDTLMIERLSVTPGIRYDHTNTNGDFLSPSLGLTYQATTRNLLRGYVARGFNTPPLFSTYGPGSSSYLPNPDLEVEKVWSAQAGIESTALRYICIKTILFYHDIWDAISKQELLDPNGTPIGKSTANQNRQRRQGIDLEIKTVPFFNTSLFAGFFFVDAKDRHTGERLAYIPRYTYDIGIRHNNPKIFNVYMNGRYIYWNNSQPDSEFHNFVWDLNIMKDFYLQEKTDVRLFLSIHNLFDASQYLFSYSANPKRWIEAGLKFEF